MKALIAISLVLLLVLLGAGGYVAYHMLNEQQVQVAQTEQQQKQSGPSSAKKRALTRMRTPKNEADVLDILAYALNKSEDAVAWLQVPGTDINNVVMQGDDNYYYERRDEDGREEAYGCYFLDYECGLGEREHFSQNTIIYGHSDLTDNPDGPRFSQLFRFAKLDFAQKNPYIYLSTQHEQFVFEIFSVFYTDTDFDYIRVAMTDEQKLALAQQAQQLSLYDYEVSLTAEDRLLTLSTCSTKYGKQGDKRFVVMGRLMPADAPLKEKLLLVPRKNTK